jgi:activator of 2-hydroxyglutaryl-CoA dehydratase
MNSYLGICAGASTITTVTIENNDQEAVVKDVKSKPHDGNPRDVLSELLAEIKAEKFDSIAVTGRRFKELLILKQFQSHRQLN